MYSNSKQINVKECYLYVLLLEKIMASTLKFNKHWQNMCLDVYSNDFRSSCK